MHMLLFVFASIVLTNVAARMELDAIRCTPNGLTPSEVFQELDDRNHPIALADITKLKKLGAGGQATVHEAVYRDCIFALKCAHKEPEKLYDEYKLMKKLAMKYVAEVFGMYGDCFAMELYTHNLRQVNYQPYAFLESVYSVHDVLGYTYNILDALEHLHNHGYIYADLKPDNVLVSVPKKKAVLADFGLVIHEGSKIRGTTTKYAPLDIPGDYETSRAFDIFTYGQLLQHLFGLRIRSRKARQDIHPSAKTAFKPTFKDLNPLAYDDRDPNKLLQLSNAPVELILACIDKNPSKRPSIPEIRKQLKAFEAKQAQRNVYREGVKDALRHVKNFAAGPKAPVAVKAKTNCPDLVKDVQGIQMYNKTFHHKTMPVLDLDKIQLVKVMGSLKNGKGSAFEGQVLNCRVFIHMTENPMESFNPKEKLKIYWKDKPEIEESGVLALSYGKIDAVVPRKRTFLVYQLIKDGFSPKDDDADVSAIASPTKQPPTEGVFWKIFSSFSQTCLWIVEKMQAAIGLKS